MKSWIRASSSPAKVLNYQKLNMSENSSAKQIGSAQKEGPSHQNVNQADLPTLYIVISSIVYLIIYIISYI